MEPPFAEFANILQCHLNRKHPFFINNSKQNDSAAYALSAGSSPLLYEYSGFLPPPYDAEPMEELAKLAINKLFMLLRDPGYRVVLCLARHIGVLFQTRDGHFEV